MSVVCGLLRTSISCAGPSSSSTDKIGALKDTLVPIKEMILSHYYISATT